MKAKVTDTGSSTADTILPKPTPVKGNPLFNRIGGKTVPKTESKIPQVYKIEVSNVFIAINSSEIKCKSRYVGSNCVSKLKINTIVPPPKSINKLRLNGFKCFATLLVLYKVIEKDTAARNPNKNPLKLNEISLLKILVAKAVPNNTNTTAANFANDGIFLLIKASIKTPIQTDCINKTTAIDALMYFTHR